MLKGRRSSHSVSVPLVDLFDWLSFLFDCLSFLHSGAVLEWASAKGVSGQDEAGGCGQEEPLLGVCVVAITDVVEDRA